MNQHRKQVIITAHARERLAERMPEVNKNNYRQLATSARYSGKLYNTVANTNPQLAKYIDRKAKDNSTQIRVYRDHAFVFRGQSSNSHKLVTVIPLPKYLKEQAVE